MSRTHVVTMGDRGRLVVPQELRERAALEPGTVILLVETDAGLAMLTRAQAKQRLRSDLARTDLVAELLDDRRRAAARGDEV